MKSLSASRKLRIAVIFGGRSGEHEVSLMSAQSVLSVLNPDLYEVIQVGITREGHWVTGEDVLPKLELNHLDELHRVLFSPEPGSTQLYLQHPTQKGVQLKALPDVDVYFPVLHGTFGEDGTLQGMLELADVAYIGAGVTGSAVGMDKAIFKDVMRAQGIPVIGSIVALRSEVENNIEAVIRRAEQLGDYPVFTKPANLGSSVGITKCNTRSDLGEGILEAARYDRRILIEKAVNQAREIEVSVLGNDDPQASVPGEVLPSREFYSYESKYIDGTSGLEIPAKLPPGLTEKIRSYAVLAFKAIDCAGMARVDFFVEKDTEALYLNELNSIPGFTQISMYPKLWEASGISYPELVEKLIQLALERKRQRSRTEHDFRRNA